MATKKRNKPSTRRKHTLADGRITAEALDATGHPFGYSFKRLTGREASALLSDMDEDSHFATAEFLDGVQLRIDGFDDPLEAPADVLAAAGFEIVNFSLAAGRGLTTRRNT